MPLLNGPKCLRMMAHGESMRILNAAQMQEADRRTIEEIGVPSIVLMENAGREASLIIENMLKDVSNRRITVLCGQGSNGGDGLVVSRTLQQRGTHVSTFLLAKTSSIQGDALLNINILDRLGLKLVEILNEKDWSLHRQEILESDLIVDAILGTGLNKPLTGKLQVIVKDINQSGIPICSIDLPSGLSADTHEIIGETVHASITVTLGAPKLPLVISPGKACVGNLVIADIGIPKKIVDDISGPSTLMITPERIKKIFPIRSEESHKGTYGHVLIVAGSLGKTGAAKLAALGALRSGAGLVTVATPNCCVPIIASQSPEYMTVGLPDSQAGTLDLSSLEHILKIPCNVIAVGPGLGRSSELTQLVKELLKQTKVSLVLDADAINALASDTETLKKRNDLDIIMTPHPGEMANLLGSSSSAVQANRVEVARSFSIHHRIHLILKGSNTVIAKPNGEVSINSTGNPGMATGGTGDVLTGIVASWYAQLPNPEIASEIAVYIHGLAGDLAEKEQGQVGLIATDIVNRIGQATIQILED